MRHLGPQLIAVAIAVGASLIAYQGVLEVPDHQSGWFIVGIVAVACGGIGSAFYIARCLIQLAADAVAHFHAAAKRRALPSTRPKPGTPGRPVAGEPSQWETMRVRGGGGEPTETIAAIIEDAPASREACADNDDLLVIGWTPTRSPRKAHHRAPGRRVAVGSWRGNGWGI